MSVMGELFAGGHLRFLEGEWRNDDGDVVDVAEVVRCKDCVSCEPVPKALRWMYLDNCIHCSAHDTIMLPDGFCSNGERKDGE